jgi:O-succinylhomoserine sulfhydrylase
MMSNNKSKQSWRPATNLVRGGLERSQFGETSEALFMTSGYIYESAEQAERAFKREEDRYIYSRYANPTVRMLENRMSLMEGAKYCQAFSSGMAAVFSALASQLKTRDRVVASRALFGSCHYIITEQLPRFGIETVIVDGRDLDAWEKALSTPTNAVFLETPSNPTLEIVNLKAVTEMAHSAGAKVIVDNIFATPVLQHPFEYGSDIIVYSTTKHIDGQGRTMGGALLTNDQEFFENQMTPFIRHTGPCMSPFSAWVCLKGLETLPIRVNHHCTSTLDVANYLSELKGINRVIYPGLKSHPQHDLAMSQMSAGGTIVSFEVAGGKEGAFKFLNALELIDISNNLGDAKSLATHPATTTHSRLSPEERAEFGIGDDLVRVSVGLEDVDDIKEDLARALQAARG